MKGLYYLIGVLAIGVAVLLGLICFGGCTTAQRLPPRKFPPMCDHRALDGSCVLTDEVKK